MSVLFVVLPLGILLGATAVVGFLIAARKGQFDDLVTPAVRMLHDDVEATPRASDAGPPMGLGPGGPAPRRSEP